MCPLGGNIVRFQTFFANSKCLLQTDTQARPYDEIPTRCMNGTATLPQNARFSTQIGTKNKNTSYISVYLPYTALLAFL